MAEGDRQGPHDLRRQEPAPELPRRRRALLVQPRRGQRHQRRAAGLCRQALRRRRRSSSSRSTSPTCWPSRPSTRTGARSAAACRTTWPTATCRRTATATRRSSSSRAASSSTATSTEVLPVDGKDPQQVQEFVAHSWYEYADGDDAGQAPVGRRDEAQLHRAQAALRAARRRSRSTAGSRRRAGRATRWRSGRWPACSSPTRPGARR